SVKRTAELSKNFSRPLRGLVRRMRSNRSTEVLGYCQSSRFAGLNSDFLCKSMSAVLTSDDTLVIETPERVPLHFALASICHRFIACAIDHTIQIVALITLGIIFAIITDAPDIGSWLLYAP